jgi:hypothetical protein
MLMNVIVVKDSPIKDGPALHGSQIGYVYGNYNVKLEVDPNLNDGWARITTPATWRDTGKVGWIEFAHVVPEGQGPEMQLLINIDANGNATIERIK